MENLLARLLQTMNVALQSGRPEQAVETGKKGLALCEQVWGPDSLHACIVLVPLSRAYEVTGDTENTEKCLVQCDSPFMKSFCLLV